MALTKTKMKKIVLAFPEAHEKLSHGKPCYFVANKFFTRLRDENNSMVLIVGSIDERDVLLEAEPQLFHITDHYRSYPTVLARMEKLNAATLRGLLERRWRQIAPRKLLKQFGDPTSG